MNPGIINNGTLTAPDGSCPTIYVLEDISYDNSTNTSGIRNNVKVIGAKGGAIGEKPTMKSAGAYVIRIVEVRLLGIDKKLQYFHVITYTEMTIII